MSAMLYLGHLFHNSLILVTFAIYIKVLNSAGIVRCNLYQSVEVCSDCSLLLTLEFCILNAPVMFTYFLSCIFSLNFYDIKSFQGIGFHSALSCAASESC
jgi:hypothetical protein